MYCRRNFLFEIANNVLLKLRDRKLALNHKFLSERVLFNAVWSLLIRASYYNASIICKKHNFGITIMGKSFT